jgi:hypothetical protein
MRTPKNRYKEFIGGCEWGEKGRGVEVSEFENGEITICFIRECTNSDIVGLKPIDVIKGKINDKHGFRYKGKIVTGLNLSPEVARALYFILRKKFGE